MTQYIGHTNKIEDATSITVTSEATGFEKENAYDWLLHDWWKKNGTGTAIFTVDFGSSVEIESWGVAGHNWSDGTGDIVVQRSATGAFSGEQTTVQSISNPSSSIIVYRVITPATDRYWRIYYNGTGGPYYASQLFLGDALALPHAPRLGFVSPKNAAEDDISNNMSDGGFNLGRSVYSEGSKFSIDMSKVDESWVDTNWQTLYEAIRSHAFFYVWDQENRPTEAAFCWTDGKIKNPALEAYATDPQMQFSIPCRGVVE